MSAARLYALLAGALAIVGVATARAETFVEFESSLRHDANLTNAAPREDRRAAPSIGASVRGGVVLVPSGYDVVTLDAQLAGSATTRYPDLDAVVIGAAFQWRHKLALGRHAPWLAARAAVAREDYRGDLRDGDRLTLALELGARLSETVEAGVGALHEHRYGDYDVPLVPGYSGRVFDLAGIAVHAWTSIAAADDWLLGARIAVRRGDVESTAQPSLPIYVASDAIAPDPAFGDPSLFAYRLPGTTWSAALAASYALSGRASLNATIGAALTRSPQDLEYRNRYAVLSILFRTP